MTDILQFKAVYGHMTNRDMPTLLVQIKSCRIWENWVAYVWHWPHTHATVTSFLIATMQNGLSHWRACHFQFSCDSIHCKSIWHRNT